jgi:hypothetical protein
MRGSIAWTDREARYSQVKLELYGLFPSLHSVKLYIIGVANLTVEVDAKYIKGMIKNPGKPMHRGNLDVFLQARTRSGEGVPRPGWPIETAKDGRG